MRWNQALLSLCITILIRDKEKTMMANAPLYYLIVINVVTFFVYGIDKLKAVSQRGQSQTRLSYAERKQPRPKAKAKQGSSCRASGHRSSGRISEATLLMLAVIGGSIGALLGMKVWHHKTLHKKFKYGLPLILIIQIALIGFLSK